MSNNLSLDEKGKKILDEFIHRLTESFDIHAVVVFGSAVKGGWNHRSDIDLLIISDDMGSDWYHRNLAAQQLSKGKIQPFVVTLDDFRLATRNRRYLIWEALYEGIAIVDDGVFSQAQARFRRFISEEHLKKRSNGWYILNSEILEQSLIESSL